MSSSISLLPSVEFLEAIARQQWRTDAEYAIAFSTIPARFFSTTNSEWLCLNSESELLSSRFGTAAIEPDFGFTRAESSPVFVASNGLKIPDKQLNAARSLFLYRSNGETEEIIFNSNFNRRGSNQTTAPLLDCFSRECMSWFPSSSDYFIGFGSLAGSLSESTIGEDRVILTKSEDILDRLNHSMTQAISYTSIDFYKPTTDSPYVFIEFGTGVIINPQSDVDTVFLFAANGNDSLVSFACQNIGTNPAVATMELSVSFASTDIIII